jgi:hypothetical protein
VFLAYPYNLNKEIIAIVLLANVWANFDRRHKRRPRVNQNTTKSSIFPEILVLFWLFLLPPKGYVCVGKTSQILTLLNNKRVMGYYWKWKERQV